MIEEKERIKLDELLKNLLEGSNSMLVSLLNGLFQEDFSPENTKVILGHGEFVDNNFAKVQGDLFAEMESLEKEKVSFHVEFQLKNDAQMAIRMFDYGYKKAVEKFREKNSLVKNEAQEILYFPKQCVIFFEQNEKIKDSVSLKVVFPDNQEVLYKVPTIRYWEMSKHQLLETHMIALIPLKLFSFRRELENTRKSTILNETDKEAYLLKMAKEIKDVAMEIGLAINEAKQEGYIGVKDEGILLNALRYLVRYLSENFLRNEELVEEVEKMTKTLYHEVHEEGKIEGKTKSILVILESKGTVSDEQKKLIEAQSEEQILDKWLVLAATHNIVDFFQLINH